MGKCESSGKMCARGYPLNISQRSLTPENVSPSALTFQMQDKTWALTGACFGYGYFCCGCFYIAKQNDSHKKYCFLNTERIQSKFI